MAEVQKQEENKQYIVAKIGCEQYGIDIAYVDNIVRMQKITRVPKTQPYFLGVINLRGEIIPVMSMHKKLELGEDEMLRQALILLAKRNGV